MKGNMADMLNAIEDTLSDAGVEASTDILANNYDAYIDDDNDAYAQIANFIEEQGIQGEDVLQFIAGYFGNEVFTDDFAREFRYYFTGEYD